MTTLSREGQKYLIVQLVTTCQGLKLTQLAMDTNVMECCVDITGFVSELVKEGKLLEVEYTPPNMRYQLKSFLLPASTEVTFRARALQYPLNVDVTAWSSSTK